jgi:hypothetical protein
MTFTPESPLLECPSPDIEELGDSGAVVIVQTLLT